MTGRMVPIDDYIRQLQAIRERYGNTPVYVRDAAWGSVALRRQREDEERAKETEGFCPACQMKCKVTNDRTRCCDQPAGGTDAEMAKA